MLLLQEGRRLLQLPQEKLGVRLKEAVKALTLQTIAMDLPPFDFIILSLLIKSFK